MKPVMKPLLLKLLRWALAAMLALLILSLQSGARHFNPAERAAAPFLYDIVRWEFDNFLSKWTNRVADALSGGGADDVRKYEQVSRYFDMGAESARFRYELRLAAANGGSGRMDELQAKLIAAEAPRQALADDVEETIEAAISAVLAAEGLATFGEFIFPPVDIRLTEPPKLLVTSPRNRIARTHDVLLRSDVTLLDRQALEDGLFSDANLAALVEDIGGLATYPASVPTTQSLRWTLQASAHEWLHHHFFFRPLGQNMFANADMVTLNETIASIAGKEIGDRAFVIMGGEIPAPAPSIDQAAGDAAAAPQAFDFGAEMNQTRRRVDALLQEGDIEGAEAYMERRRLLFVENGYPIRKLNQAYFAFYGTYADLPASVSPIGEQVRRFRDLTPDLGDFIARVADISDYDEFLRMLRALESESAK